MSGTNPDDDDSVVPLSAQSNRPLDTAFRQQRVKAWYPILDPWWVIGTFVMFGAIFIPTGYKLQSLSDNVVEIIEQYDAFDKPHKNCSIGNAANSGKVCTIEMTLNKDVDPPIFIHYQLENFYQNHRQYVNSRDDYQLAGWTTQTSLQANNCKPLNVINGTRINPCGLIANTLFNDIITLLPTAKSPEGDVNVTMREDGIAWQSDITYRYKQPADFQSEVCPNANDSCNEASTCCDEAGWSCKKPYLNKNDGLCYRYTYPNDDTTQYLYETYPDIVSPLEGVTNEHFAVWMRVAALPKFRKLYGWIDVAIAANTTLTFEIRNNFEVFSFEGRKSLVLSTNHVFGGSSAYLGPMFYYVGFFLLIAAAFFAAKQSFRPRRIGDKRYLQYKEE